MNSLKLNIYGLLVMIQVALFGFSVSAEAGDAAAGQDKSALCAGCHGSDGNSADVTIPRLAGQYEGYIVKQISDFQRGHRTNNETMAGMSMTVASVEDAMDIGAYFQQQTMAGLLTEPDKKLVAAGEQLFVEGNPKKGLYGCINCHGKSGKGMAAHVWTFPVIGGQHRDYIIKQLQEFRAGGRANDPAGMMGAIASKLSDKQIIQLAEYLSTQL